MSFRLFNLGIYRAALAGLVCLGSVWASSAGDLPPERIEVVPLKGSTIDTNFDQSPPTDTKDLDSMFPHAPRSFNPTPPSQRLIPLPQSQTPVLSQRERELLDRRRNWVFMTPEEFASPNGEKGLADGKNDDTAPTTAMERYYQRLYDADHATMTNQFSKPDSDRWNAATNSSGGGLRNGALGFSESPFNVRPDSGVFQSASGNDSASVFRSDSDPGMLDPETVRLRAEQKAHIDSFKELWNIDQPADTASASTPAASVGSASIFDSPQGVQSSFKSADSSSSSGNPSSSLQTPQPSVTSMRNNHPPHADFAPPHRDF